VQMPVAVAQSPWRRRVAAAATRRPGCAGVFDSDPPQHFAERRRIKLAEVSDALDVTATIPAYEERTSYCASLGIDYDRAAAYYERVAAMERAFHASPSIFRATLHESSTGRQALTALANATAVAVAFALVDMLVAALTDFMRAVAFMVGVLMCDD
jgi:hypothetical protein